MAVPMKIRQTTTSGAVVAGVASTQVLAANPQRAAAVIVNDSNNPVWLAIDNPAIINSGMRLNGPGGTLNINSAYLPLGQINAISVGGADVLTVTEHI